MGLRVNHERDSGWDNLSSLDFCWGIIKFCTTNIGKKKSSKISYCETECETETRTAIPDVASITAFMNQVAGLVELVDLRDIMEL
ncbi:unnamed protein product [Lactuca virosa]|uniref:Uncharacterized protein n=1 Tax=Lactuca virosa TaxID=75947 RepID=A0AAU9MT80_9ASTR|nr:unnamed protein product [Lactuca virosa]